MFSMSEPLIAGRTPEEASLHSYDRIKSGNVGGEQV